MVLSIGTNNSAAFAADPAYLSNRNMEASMQRLSTGKRINSASDDAAGVAIASRLSSVIRGTDQSIRNSMDALFAEIDRIAGTTTWAGSKLINDSNGTDFSFQVGTATGAKTR